MLSTPTPYCDCCSLAVQGQEEDCLHCGYPVSPLKERHFLEAAVSDLKRVARHGGAQLTVQILIQRYQRRLTVLRQPVVATIDMAQAQAGQAQSQLEEQATKSVGAASMFQPADLSSASLEFAEPARAFSLVSFFADQTINIVASLGAFLILVGSLSFVATTTNLLLSLLVMFLVHAIFGAVGVVTYRFRSFRTVAAIYTAIFALLVPLVGFSGYRLIAGHLIPLSTPTLIAIVAAYAALAYGALAIYQHFQPFGYLAAISLIVVDLAIALAYQLNVWWWPCLLMILAFGSLVAVPNQPAPLRLFQSYAAVLLAPVRFLMVVCMLIGVLTVTVFPMASLAVDELHRPLYELRTATFLLSLCIFIWFTLFIWLKKYKDEASGVAYLFLYSTLLFCYMLNVHQTGYALALTAVALLYHGINRAAPRWLQSLVQLCEHLNGIALLLVIIVPFLATPFIPWTLLWSVTYGSYGFADTTLTLPISLTVQLAASLVMVLVGCAITVSVVLRHTGLHRAVDKNHLSWTWLLLVSGFLFSWAWMLVTALLGIAPVWSLLALTLLFVACTLFTRRAISADWANPLDVLALCTSFLTLAYCFSQSVETSSLLFFFFAALSYGMVLYQRRSAWLFVSLIFLLTVLPVFILRPRALFITSLFLPFIAVIVHRSYTNHRPTRIVIGPQQISARAVLWEWPLLASGLVYSLVFLYRDYASTSSVVQQWLGYPFPVVLELTLTALAWYGAAALIRVKWWLVVVGLFGCLAVLLPTNTLTELRWIAPTLALCAFSVSRLSDRGWATPLYVSSVLAGIVLGAHGLLYGQTATVALLLLGFAGVLYLIGVAENLTLFLWLATAFAIWSVTYMARLEQGNRLLAVALFCTAIGAVSLLLHRIRPVWFMREQHNRRMTYVLPLYTVAVAAALLTGLFSLLYTPFATGILGAFIVLTLCILLMERVPLLFTVPIGLALVTIAQLPWLLWQQLLACSLLFVLVFAARFIWDMLPSASKFVTPQRLHEWSGLLGQSVVVYIIATNGGLTTSAGVLAYVGAGALLLLSVLTFWYGMLHTEQATRRCCLYIAGCLLSFVVSWEQVAFQQTHLDVLLLVPATYLIVVTPFISRDQHIVSRHVVGQCCSILGAALLLLPSLWSSFSQDNLHPTLILAGESLALFIIGVSTRIRFFILSGAALVMVSAMHALFLPTLGIPPFVAMAILGITLLLLATVLKLMSARIKVLWNAAE